MAELPGDRYNHRLESAFHKEERDAVAFGGHVRMVAVLPVALWVWLENPGHQGLYYVGLILLLGLSGLLSAWLVRSGRYRAWMKYALAAADAILLAYILLMPNPLAPTETPLPLQLQLGNFVYAFLLLLFAAFPLSPRLVIWTGLWLAGAGTAAALWVGTRPGALSWANLDLGNSTLDDFMRIYLDPQFVVLEVFYRHIVAILVAAGMLAAAVSRARGLVRRQVRSALERANLARYFSPNIIDDLSQGREDLGREREQPVGVLFADLAGFTHMCETLSPPQVMDLLRRFRGRMEHAVFANGGTLDKYIGDAVMATFGTPHPGRRDASNTVRCAIAMVEALEHWNEERAAQGQPRLRLGVGADYGPCMVGDIGGEARLEFTVIGDTVNVASRLEELSRTLASDVVISDTLAEAVRAEGQGALIDTFVASAPLHVRGREREIAVLTWSGPESATAAQGPS